MSTGAITQDAVTSLVSRVLRKHFGGLRYAHQRVADIAHADPRAARNWMDGSNPPNTATLLTLMRECKELREEINRMLDGPPPDER
ncbi:hypothetical protein [Pseudoroseomonas cervicalis]|uniref:hypothetical protein n=1 Tax=Teichococcus cervicalis TaxID=204525 RepID=UPI0027D887CA|nr:hypothetical protein [Pseudoroseomonas cervicalis]